MDKMERAAGAIRGDESVDVPPKLSIVAVLSAVMTTLRVRRWVWLRTLSLWSLVLVIGMLEGEPSDDLTALDVVSILLIAMAYPMLAVTIHRVVLLGEGTVPHYGLLIPTFRELWYGLILLVMTSVLFQASELFAEGILRVVQFAVSVDVNSDWMLSVALIPFFYLLGRFCFILPEIAVERDDNLDSKTPWKMTRGNGWRLALLVGAIPWGVQHLYKSVVELLGTNLFLDLAINAGWVFLWIVEILILSISFDRLAWRGAGRGGTSTRDDAVHV